MHACIELARHYRWTFVYAAVAGLALGVVQTAQVFRA